MNRRGERAILCAYGPSFAALRTSLGSNSLTTSITGTEVARTTYYPYGGTRTTSGTQQTDRLFTDQRAESAALGALYDYGARHYDTVIGRFLSADSIVPGAGNPQALNRYSYVLGNPMKYVDPTGYDPSGLDAGAGACDSLRCMSELMEACGAEHPCYEINERANAQRLFWKKERTGTLSENENRVLEGLLSELTIFDNIRGIYTGELTRDQRVAAMMSASEFAPVAGMAAGKVIANGAADAVEAVAGNTFGRTLKPGPYAKESIPARGPDRNFTMAEKAEINRIGNTYGCHTCGTKDPGTVSGDWVLDHQPPNRLNVNQEPQQLLPQCLHCMHVQGGEVREYIRQNH